MGDWFSGPLGWLIVGGSLMVIILVVIAGYYLLALRKQQLLQNEQAEALRKASDEKIARMNNSIQIIAQAVGQEQVTLTEAAIRIRGLLESLAVNEGVREEFKAFFLLAEATSHIPILEEWKALSTKQKLVFDHQREQLEKDHREFVEDAARRIQGRRF